MSAPATRTMFDGLNADERRDAMRELAELVERQSLILGKPTPEIAQRYLAPVPRG